MATIPTVSNFDLTKIPVEGTAEFRANASYVWSTIPSVIRSMNYSIIGMNSVITEVRSYRDTVLTVKSELQQATDEANLVRNEIHGYVIPDGTTYSPDEIDEGYAVLGNQILKLQQDFTGLNLNIKGV